MKKDTDMNRTPGILDIVLLNDKNLLVLIRESTKQDEESIYWQIYDSTFEIVLSEYYLYFYPSQFYPLGNNKYYISGYDMSCIYEIKDSKIKCINELVHKSVSLEGVMF